MINDGIRIACVLTKSEGPFSFLISLRPIATFPNLLRLVGPMDVT